ncbi:MAG: hypothetical protein EBV15_10835 [Bacteroidetes bacterium]|nr:hypothetical protein [Bacteroidota bacterium]
MVDDVASIVARVEEHRAAESECAFGDEQAARAVDGSGVCTAVVIGAVEGEEGARIDGDAAGRGERTGGCPRPNLERAAGDDGGTGVGVIAC